MDGETPQTIVLVLLLFGWQRGEVLVEQGLDAWCRRPELQVEDRPLKIVLPVRQSGRLLALPLVGLVFCAYPGKHAPHRSHSSFACQTATIHDDVSADAEQNEQCFRGGVRIGD